MRIRHRQSLRVSNYHPHHRNGRHGPDSGLGSRISKFPLFAFTRATLVGHSQGENDDVGYALMRMKAAYDGVQQYWITHNWWAPAWVCVCVWHCAKSPANNINIYPQYQFHWICIDILADCSRMCWWWRWWWNVSPSYPIHWLNGRGRVAIAHYHITNTRAEHDQGKTSKQCVWEWVGCVCVSELN